MANPEIAALIAEGLQKGFVHPGDPERDIKPTPIVLPFKPSAGMPKEMGDLLSSTAKMLGECIVELIETKGASEIVPVAEAKTMRRAVSKAPKTSFASPVYCRCDTGRSNPLVSLTILDPEAIVVDGPALIRGMHARQVECPHEPVDL